MSPGTGTGALKTGALSRLRDEDCGHFSGTYAATRDVMIKRDSRTGAGRGLFPVELPLNAIQAGAGGYSSWGS